MTSMDVLGLLKARAVPPLFLRDLRLPARTLDLDEHGSPTVEAD
jgi:hypothetical protein